MPSTASIQELAVAPRFGVTVWDSSGWLAGIRTQRLTVHVAVLLLAAVALAVSGIHTRGEARAAADISIYAAPVAPPAIIARAIPLTVEHGAGTYVVAAGDTLDGIARRMNVPEEALLAYNRLDSADALATGMSLEIPDFSKVGTSDVHVPSAPPAAAALPPQKPAPDISTYEVKAGDTLYGLALSQGVSLDIILKANSLPEDRLLSLGQHIVIPPANGQLVTTQAGDTLAGLAERYAVPAGDIRSLNKLPDDTDALVPGVAVLIPTAPAVAAPQSQPAAAPARPQALDGAAAQAKPADQSKPELASPPRPAPTPNGGFMWPAPGIITTYFSGWHNGIDIANSAGTLVRAAQSGVVVYSGWDNSGFGYMVRIDHGNGLQTLYGHSSKLLVVVGQRVNKGDVIMLMGSTGRSTGPHVHFSVFRGSSYSGLNPLQYLS